MIAHKCSIKGVVSVLGVLILLSNPSRLHSKPFFEGPSVRNSPLPSATLAGTVVDENDAVVSDASVLVKDLGAQLKREVKTNPIGLFKVTELPPGSYIVAVQHQGFATAEIKGLALKVNDQVALKIRLKVGQVGETVTIDPDSSIVQRSPSVATSLNRQMIDNLPLTGRRLQPVITLTP